MRFRGLAEATAVLTAALALACVLTYPYAFKFGHATFRTNNLSNA